MLDFAVTLTLRPSEISSEDIARLRNAGLGDRAISHIVQITALFNYYNRIASGLGVEDEPDW